ncbi:hypothetical protein NECAME_02690 [Necator americanus]|uniref:Uncharacterized protein n=1 Tax=Necator americanus TaxID=51031 RepID=W2TCF9_NECAM|nr:hypothetical protein NECAME_02690 [Necator americanus]ETN79264.1 hypothetical protein NECAME_02690 [Necator americanus]
MLQKRGLESVRGREVGSTRSPTHGDKITIDFDTDLPPANEGRRNVACVHYSNLSRSSWFFSKPTVGKCINPRPGGHAATKN